MTLIDFLLLVAIVQYHIDMLISASLLYIWLKEHLKRFCPYSLFGFIKRTKLFTNCVANHKLPNNKVCAKLYSTFFYKNICHLMTCLKII